MTLLYFTSPFFFCTATFLLFLLFCYLPSFYFPSGLSSQRLPFFSIFLYVAPFSFYFYAFPIIFLLLFSILVICITSFFAVSFTSLFNIIFLISQLSLLISFFFPFFFLNQHHPLFFAIFSCFLHLSLNFLYFSLLTISFIS